MILAQDNGNVMVEGSTADLLAEFTCVIASIKRLCEKHFDEEKALRIIAECGKFGVELESSLDMEEFIYALDAIVKGDRLLEN